jgi:hypothetical protein
VPYEFDEDDMADLHAFLEKGRSGLHHPANTSAMMGTHPSPASKWQGLAEKPLL